MNIKNQEISIIPFSGNNFVSDKEYIIGRIISYKPLSDEGYNNITLNENNDIYNFSGITAYCKDILDDNSIEILYEDFKLKGLIKGIKSICQLKPIFVFGDLVESLNGTTRQGHIFHIFWHGKEEEFKYLIKDIKGKKISRRYSASDLKLIQ